MAYTPPPPAEADRAELAPRAGLCAGCRHLQVLRSRRSVFVRCARADREAGFARYPPLPVRTCGGFEAATEGEEREEPVDTVPGPG